jgi:F-type H+-transporting ATPase subunit delta
MRKAPKTIAQAIIRSLQIKEVGPLNELIGDLDLFHGSFRQTKIFKTVKSMLVKPSEKRAIFQKIFPQLPFGAESQAVLMMLADRNQVSDLPRLIVALKEIRLRDHNICDAEVVTVKPLDKEQKAKTNEILSKISGSEVLVKETLNPSILGGLVFRLQDSVIDASLVRKIVEMRKQLTA